MEEIDLNRVGYEFRIDGAVIQFILVVRDPSVHLIVRKALEEEGWKMVLEQKVD